jgi:hypothetical protein
MGQYYKIANLDKKQYLHPHRCGDGLKLMEFSLGSCGTMSALAILLADGNGRGGGDLRSDAEIIGSWSGDRITIVGDYADGDLFSEIGADDSEWTDVSADAMAALAEDDWAREHIRKSW